MQKNIEKEKDIVFHENPRDVFMLLLEGEIEFFFENGEKLTVRKGECFVLSKNLKHACIFRKNMIALEAVYEKVIYTNVKE